MKNLQSVTQVSKATGLSKSTIRRRARLNNIGIKPGGYARLFTPDDVEALKTCRDGRRDNPGRPKRQAAAPLVEA